MNNEDFKVGDAVEIGRISSVGTIVAIDGDYARVQLPGLVVRSALNALKRTAELPSRSAASSGSGPGSHIKLHSKALESGASSLFTLDLHGKTTADAVELLEQQVSRAVMAGMHEIEVVHGVGTGRVREVVHARLAALHAVARFEIKYTNHGVTRVFLRA